MLKRRHPVQSPPKSDRTREKQVMEVSPGFPGMPGCFAAVQCPALRQQAVAAGGSDRRKRTRSEIIFKD